MREVLVTSADGYHVRTFVGPWDNRKPTLTFVLPFSVKFEFAQPFLVELVERFNVVSWEARMILDDPSMHADVTRLTPELHVADMMSVLSYLEVARTDVIGYCSGAGIALLAAQQAPDRFSRLVLLGGEYVLPQQVCPRSRYQQDIDALLPMAAQSRTYAAAIFGKLNQRKQPVDDLIARATALPFSHQEYLYRLAANYITYRKCDFLEVAAAIAHPTLVLVGQCDEQVTIKSSVLIHQRLRNGELHIDPTGDHHDVSRGITPGNLAAVEFLTRGN